MRRFSLWPALGAFLFLGIAYHVAAQVPNAQETAAMDTITRWKLVNTGIFALGLAYLIAKYAPAFFNARSSEIQKAIQDATGLKIEAEFRSSEIDRKMATLGDQVKKLREQYAAEMEREHDRVRHETKAEIDHIHRNVAAEVEALRVEGTQTLQRHTAELALQMAEGRLRDRLASDSQDDLLQDFIHLVGQGRN